jgi:hypothetical protein
MTGTATRKRPEVGRIWPPVFLRHLLLMLNVGRILAATGRKERLPRHYGQLFGAHKRTDGRCNIGKARPKRITGHRFLGIGLMLNWVNHHLAISVVGNNQQAATGGSYPADEATQGRIHRLAPRCDRPSRVVAALVLVRGGNSQPLNFRSYAPI